MVASLSPESAPKNRTSVELRGEREIIISRTFNAPARIVFDAWTRPEFVKRWWAPQAQCVTMVGCEADVRVGGAYRYQLRTPDGNAFAFSGRYTEITPPSRLVYTQVFEPMAEAGEMRITVTFEEREGKTHLVSHELYPSADCLLYTSDAADE